MELGTCYPEGSCAALVPGADGPGETFEFRVFPLLAIAVNFEGAFAFHGKFRIHGTDGMLPVISKLLVCRQEVAGVGIPEITFVKI